MGFELDYIFHPQSVAIAGASESPDKQGHNYFKNLLEDFDGPVYPINIRAESVLGQKTYKSIRDLPTDVDYVISAIPNRDIEHRHPVGIGGCTLRTPHMNVSYFLGQILSHHL